MAVDILWYSCVEMMTLDFNRQITAARAKNTILILFHPILDVLETRIAFSPAIVAMNIMWYSVSPEVRLDLDGSSAATGAVMLSLLSDNPI